MDLEKLTNNYQTITGTMDNLTKLANSLKQAKQPFQWVKVTRKGQPEQNATTTALNISRDVYNALRGL